jgi:predicted secreted hydrolase
MLRGGLLLVLTMGIVAAIPVAHGSTCDGNAYLQNYSCHAATRVTMDGFLDRTKWSNQYGYYGPFTLVLPGSHTFKFTHPGFYSETHTFAVGLIGNTRLPAITLENCALCSPTSWQHYPYTIPGTAIQFPSADGKHMPFSSYPVEWWYANFYLTSTSTGHNYVFWFACFKFPQMVLMSATDLTTGETYSADRYPLTFIAAEDHLDITASLPPFTDHWYNETCGGSLTPFESWMDVNFLSEGVIDGWFHMRALKKPIPVSGDGLIQAGGGFSYYYSQTRMDVWAVLHLPGGPALGEEMHGIGWMDHQWGNIPGEWVTWEWLSMQLSGNREIMVANLWEDGVLQVPSTLRLNYVDASCNLEAWDDFTMTPLAFWTDPVSGRQFAVKWQITLNKPTRQINLVVNRRVDNSMMRIGVFDLLPLNFWEGPCTVSGTINGQAVSGTAFAELTHSQAGSVGYCCLDGGTCALMSEVECAEQGGVFGGAGTTCSQSQACGLGVCCLGRGCQLLAETVCASRSGTWHADWTTCDPSPCSRSDAPESPHLTRTALVAPQPSPWTGTALIHYNLAEPSMLRIELFDASGRVIRLLLDQPAGAGEGVVQWDGRDDAGNVVAPGAYFCRMNAGGQVMTQRIVLLR